jgi:hypothetical protein
VIESVNASAGKKEEKISEEARYTTVRRSDRYVRLTAMRSAIQPILEKRKD